MQNKTISELFLVTLKIIEIAFKVITANNLFHGIQYFRIQQKSGKYEYDDRVFLSILGSFYNDN